MGTDFFDQGYSSFLLTFEQVRGEGRVAPRLVLSFKGRPRREQTRVDVGYLSADVWLESEMLGSGTMRDVTARFVYGACQAR